MTIETKIAKNGSKRYYVRNENGKLSRISRQDALMYQRQAERFEQWKANNAHKPATVEVEDYTVSTEAQEIAIEAETELANSNTDTEKIVAKAEENATTVYVTIAVNSSNLDDLEKEELEEIHNELEKITEGKNFRCNAEHGICATVKNGHKASAVEKLFDNYGLKYHRYAFTKEEPAVEAETEQAQAQTAPTVVFNEQLFDNFKFETGRTYFRLNEDGTPFTLKVEARTAHMLTGTTSEGTRKYKVAENMLGEYVQTGKDDGYNEGIMARNEFIPAIVEIAKVKQEAFNVWAGKTPNDDTEPEAPDNQPNVTEKFIATQITFPNGHEGEPTREVSKTFNNLGDAAKFIADDYPLIRDENDNIRTAYDGNFFGGIYWAGWKIATADGKILCEVDCLGNTHGDEEIDNLVCKYFDENDQFIIPDVPGFLADEAQDDYKDFRPKVEIVKATFKNSEVLDVKEILAPLADQAQVELGNITLADNDDKTCTVNIEVKGSTNEIEKFKALLDGRQPEPPTNSKKFIKAALDTEPERYQQVATARKEVVASSAEAIAMTKQYALAKVEVKFEKSDSNAKLWFENTHLLDGYNTDNISWRRIKKAKASEILARFNMTIEDFVAEYERELEEIRERNRKAFEERSRNHKPHPARMNRFAPKPDDKPCTESKPEDFTAELDKLTAEQSDGSEEDSEEEFIAVIPTDDSEDDDDELIDPPAESPAEKSDYEIGQDLSALFVKAGINSNYMDVTLQDGKKIVTCFGSWFIQPDWDADNGFIFTNRHETFAHYDTPAQVETVIEMIKATNERRGDKFTFPTVEELTAPTAHDIPYKWKLNTDIAERDKIIFGEYDPDAYPGGIRNFEGMTLDTLKKLVEKNFIRPAERQNEAPTTAQILAFMERYREYTAHGYAVTSKRFDYRVTIEGVSKGKGAETAQELEDFTRLFGNADNFNTGIMDCWFD